MRDENGSNSNGFQMVVRLAGWNDIDHGMQIMLGHEDGAWSFHSSEGQGLDLPEAVGRDLARLFLQAAKGDGVGPTDGWALPPDRHWLIEGFGLSEVLTMDQPIPKQWPITRAAMVVYKVHQLLLGGAFEPAKAVAAVVGRRDDGDTLRVAAGWTQSGFVYRIIGADQVDQPEMADVSSWPAEGTASDLEAILPSLGDYRPAVVHPVAAWAVLSAIEPLETAATELEHHLWRFFATRAITGCKVKEVEEVETDEEVDTDEDDEDDVAEAEVEDDGDRWAPPPWQPDDANQWSVRERVEALAGYVKHMTPENMEALGATYTHTIIVAYFERLAYDYGWVSPRVDWQAWLASEAGKRLHTQCDAVLGYDIDGLVSIITAMVRGERFAANTLSPALYAFGGDITTCASRLLAELDAGVPLTATLFADVSRT